MGKSYFNADALEAIFAQCVETGRRKNRDYGAARDNIAQHGVPGVAVRMDDKMARILWLSNPSHEPGVKDEALRDTLLDMINYGAYAIMILDGTWGVQPPTVPKPPDHAGANQEIEDGVRLPVEPVEEKRQARRSMLQDLIFPVDFSPQISVIAADRDMGRTKKKPVKKTRPPSAKKWKAARKLALSTLTKKKGGAR